MQSLVLSSDGTLFVGTAVSASSGALVSLDPATGAVLKMTGAGAIQSLALNGDVLYAAYNTPGGNIGGFVASSLAPQAFPPCGGGGPTYSGIALRKSGGANGVFAVGAINSTNGRPSSLTRRVCSTALPRGRSTNAPQAMPATTARPSPRTGPAARNLQFVVARGDDGKYRSASAGEA